MKLSRYRATFDSNGFDRLAILALMTADDLRVCGVIDPEHTKLLLTAIANLTSPPTTIGTVDLKTPTLKVISLFDSRYLGLMRHVSR